MNTNQLLTVLTAINLLLINQILQVNSAGTTTSCQFEASYGIGSNMSVVTHDNQEFHVEKLFENGYPVVSDGQDFTAKWSLSKGYTLDTMLEKGDEVMLIKGDNLRVYGPGQVLIPGRNMTTEFPELSSGVADPRIYIRAATEVKGTTVMIASVDDGATNHVYFFDGQGTKKMSTEFATGGKLPDSLHYLGEKDNKHLVLVNFDIFTAIYRLPSIDKPDDFKLVPRRDIDFHLTSEWTGCMPDFCWNGDIDAGTVVPKGGFVGFPGETLAIFRGNYMTMIDGTANGIEPIAQKFPVVFGYIDGVMHYQNMTYFVKGDKLITVDANNQTRFIGLSDLFVQFNATSGTVSDILRLENKVGIFQGNKYSIYEMTSANSSKLETAESDLRTGFPGLVHDSIDAAYEIKGQVHLHAGNFYYKNNNNIPVTSGVTMLHVTGPMLAQEDFFTCKTGPASAIYPGAYSLNIGVSSYDEFIAYKMGFAPGYVDPVTPAPAPTPGPSEDGSSDATTTTTDEPVPKADDSKVHLIILGLLAIVVFFVLLACVCYVFMDSKKPATVTKRSPQAPHVAASSLSTVPMVTSGVAPSSSLMSVSPVTNVEVVTTLPSRQADGSAVARRSELDLLNGSTPAI